MTRCSSCAFDRDV